MKQSQGKPGATLIFFSSMKINSLKRYALSILLRPPNVNSLWLIRLVTKGIITVSNIMALRNEEWGQVNIYIYKLHFYSNK